MPATPDAFDARQQHTSSRMFSGLRAGLETLALLMIVAVCGAMLFVMIRGGLVGSGSPPPRPAHAPKPTVTSVPAEPISLQGAHVQGSPAAKVAVIEYSDFQCPYCGKFARETLPALREAYIQPGQVLFAFREFPLESIHSAALKAAEAAECASRQGQFWKMHDLIFADQTHLFADQTHLDIAALEARAQTAGLDARPFAECLQGDAAKGIRDDARVAAALDIGATPTFFIGVVQPNGSVKVVKRLAGALPIGDFRAAVDPILDGARPTEPRGK